MGVLCNAWLGRIENLTNMKNETKRSLIPVELRLDEVESAIKSAGTSGRYWRADAPKDRVLLSHLLNGAGACFEAERLPEVEALAFAHGWQIRLCSDLPNAEVSDAKRSLE
jgi:hypothetical protein